ncbi:MAG: hypothetical protein WBO04_01325 [Steroidobacteraceae bacterium]
MRKVVVSLACAALLVGCASQAAPQSMAVAAPAAPSAATASAPATTAAAKSAPTAPPGYKARVRKGETVYCKTIEATGSHFPQEACFTQAQLDQQKAGAGRLLNKRAGCRIEGCVTSQ